VDRTSELSGIFQSSGLPPETKFFLLILKQKSANYGGLKKMKAIEFNLWAIAYRSTLHVYKKAVIM